MPARDPHASEQAVSLYKALGFAELSNAMFARLAPTLTIGPVRSRSGPGALPFHHRMAPPLGQGHTNDANQRSQQP